MNHEFSNMTHLIEFYNNIIILSHRHREKSKSLNISGVCLVI